MRRKEKPKTIFVLNCSFEHLFTFSEILFAIVLGLIPGRCLYQTVAAKSMWHNIF